MRLSSLLVLPFVLALTAIGCTDDSEPATDPVTGEATGASDDPSQAQPPDGAAASATESPQEDELPGALTDDPFGAPQTPSGTPDAGEAAPPAEGTAPQQPSDDYGGAFESDIDYDAPQQGNAPSADAPSAAPAAKAGTKGKSGKRVTRYVNAMLLNVRSKPSLKSPVVRRLLGGAKIDVELHGQYAKIKDGQWCRARYLSDTPTKKVSRAEVDKAWKRGKAKDKSKSGKKK